jgi:two-component system, OmpR family, osmolarity sensor histidine kinase EnvZ
VRVLLVDRCRALAVTVAPPRFRRRTRTSLLVLMILTSVLMTVIAYLFLRNQLRPIKRLADAAEAFGKGRRLPYRPRGALEVRAAGRPSLTCAAGSSGRSSSAR